MYFGSCYDQLNFVRYLHKTILPAFVASSSGISTHRTHACFPTLLLHDLTASIYMYLKITPLQKLYNHISGIMMWWAINQQRGILLVRILLVESKA